ncbi:Hypothetical protein CINCED_3A002516 [Cinara cedri]|uniref:Uncharacterized protein n=1 Tax=Cinara cedri TaxID=506608 RepID=A0A5E4MZ84_9HEMI|nr:Hypothetical protein CINCED_3A002516 [Cinara cedri]
MKHEHISSRDMEYNIADNELLGCDYRPLNEHNIKSVSPSPSESAVVKQNGNNLTNNHQQGTVRTENIQKTNEIKVRLINNNSDGENELNVIDENMFSPKEEYSWLLMKTIGLRVHSL